MFFTIRLICLHTIAFQILHGLPSQGEIGQQGLVSRIKRSDDRVCECVKTFQCDTSTREIITDGAGIIAFRVGEVCKADEVCCKLPPDESSASGEVGTEKAVYVDEDDQFYDYNVNKNTETDDNYGDDPDPEVQPQTITERAKEDKNDIVDTGVTTTPVTKVEIKPESDIVVPVKQVTTSRPSAVVPLSSSIFICGARVQSLITDKVAGDPDDTWTEQGDFPWTLIVKYLKMKDDGEAGEESEWVLLCGATLIGPSIALTVAHCVDKRIPGNLLVRAGEWDLGVDDETILPQERRVKRVIMHPKYDQRPIKYDVAIMVLERPLDKTDAVNTVCLPPLGIRLKWPRCYATGWGAGGEDALPRENAVMRKAKMPLVPHGECQDLFRKTELGRHFRLHPSFICAGGDGETDTCKGDGGGPLACESPVPPYKFYLLGITSWGVGCSRKEVPGAYTDIALVTKWIQSTVNQLMRDNVIPSD